METQREMKQLLIDETLNCIDGIIKKAKIVIDGNILIKDIHKTVRKAETIHKYVFLDTETGFVSSVSLIDEQGRELYTKEPKYQKGQAGYIIAFPIRLRVEAVGIV